MHQTFFHIPHEIGGWPVFGCGWALLVWVAFSVGLLAYHIHRHGFNAETRGLLPVLGLVAVAIWLVLPLLEERQAVPTGPDVVIGLPIRGYGTMLLIAVTAGMAVAVARARRVGLDPEIIYSLAFWMFLWAILGARIFYVVQKWDQFASVDLWQTAGKVLNFTEGGLVVYGALIGGLMAGSVFLVRRQLPILAVGDLIAPSLALGLSIGRIGCLMNGCCYGGLCRLPWHVTFPHQASSYSNVESPPYDHQHRLGMLHGIRIGPDPQGQTVVKELLDKNGPAAQAGLRVGDRIRAINGLQAETLEKAEVALARAGPRLTVGTADGRTIEWSIGQLPRRSLPVHPTQVYSSINAAILFLFLFAYYPFRRRDGEVLALMLTVYPITRFLLEIIRTDEGAVLGTAMTISQNVSLALLVAAVGFWGYVLRQPKGSALPLQSVTP